VRGKAVVLLGLLAAMAAAAPGKQGAELLIIAADSFVNSGALQPLLDWKMQKGISDTVVPLSQIGSDPDSLPDDIKDFIRYAHNNWSLPAQYVLLVGSLDPNSPFLIPPYEGEETDEQYDCGYGDIENYHQSVNDSLMEVSVGRFPANTVDEARTMVMKTVTYERHLQSSNPLWTVTGTTVVREDGDPSDSVYWNDTNILHAYWRSLSYGPCDSFSRVLGDNSNSVTQAGNAGRAFITYRGQATGNWWPPFYEIEPEAWTNGGMLPVVVGATCQTMEFYGEGGMYGDRFVRAGSPSMPRGAVAYFGTSCVGELDYRSAVYRGLFAAIYQGCSLKLGPATVRARMDVIPILEDSEDLEPYYEWNLFGDPSLHMWVGGDTPVMARIEGLPVQVMVGGTSELHLRITGLESNRSVYGARVCAWKPGEVFTVGFTDPGGHVILPVCPQTGGPLFVTASEGRENPYTDEFLDWPTIIPVEAQANCVVPPPPPWTERASMPWLPSGKEVSWGGWLAYDGNAYVYGVKGNNTRDFYRYIIQDDTWRQLQLTPLPAGSKNPSKGCRGICDVSGHVYMTKGHNTAEFWRYCDDGDSWSRQPDVPLGVNGRKVNGGTDMTYATVHDADYIYLLKGVQNEFYRFNTASGTWNTLSSVPVRPGGSNRWREGSWLIYDGFHTMYAHQSHYHQMYRYDTQNDSWSGPTQGMPLVGRSGRSKKSKDGGSAVLFDGAIYALKGGNTQEAWRYNPTSSTWTELDTLPSFGSTGRKKYVSKGADIIACTGGELLAVKGNKTREFWRYSPEQVDSGNLAGFPSTSSSPGGGRDAGETPVMDGLEASTPRWDPEPSSNMVVYSHEDTLGDGYEQVYQCFYGSSIPEQRVTEVATDCEEPVVSPPREGGQLIAFQIADTLSDCYQIAVTPAYAADGDGSDGTGEDLARKRGQSLGARGRAVQSPFSPSCPAPGTGDATAPASSVAPIGSTRLGTQSETSGGFRLCPAPGGSTMLSRPIRQLTSGDEADRLHPEFDQTGSWLCYERDVDGPGGCYTQIWRVPVDSGPEEQITFDNADHFSPTYLNTSEILFLLSPNDGYDVVAKVNMFTHQVTVLSNLQTDHDRPNPAGTYAVSEALDDAGNTQIVKIPFMIGPESWLTSGTSDIMEPDCNQDNQSVFAVRWTGITSQIVAVDAQNGGYWPVTDTLAIRDNPDGHPDPNGPTSLAVYEREAWNPLDLLLGGGRRKPGSGIYLSKFRKPHDGAQGTSLGIFALERATPNPATKRVQIRYQIPAEAVVSLRVYNTAGQLVKVLADGKTKPGAYTSVWNAPDVKDRRLANGVYFCTLDNGEERISRKVVLTE